MPVFNENSMIIDLLPILIDYEKSEEVNDKEQAFIIMKKRLDEMSTDYTF